MREIGPTPLTPYSPSDPRWALVQRVADSTYFRKGPKLRAFLLYVCENALVGRLENVREQLIGSKVFGRTSEYNLSEDNIVRVEARELRKRLEAYFAGEGRDEPVVIDIPKGTYVPVFKPREQATTPVLDAPATPEPAEPSSGRAEPRRKRWLAPLLSAGLLLVAVAAIWFLGENRRLRQQAPGIVPGDSSADYSFYPELLGSLGGLPGREALLVLSNPKVTVFYGAESQQPPAQDAGHMVLAPKELTRTYGFALKPFDRDLPFHFLSLNGVDYTGVGETVAAFRLGRLMMFLRRPVRLTQQRFLNWDHVQKQDLFLLGGPQSNEWSAQADTRANFTFARGFIENARPLPGEQKRYSTGTDPASDYGVIRKVISPYGFSMLLLAGQSSAGTAGVAEFFSDPAKMKPAYERIRATAAGKSFPSDWELLIRVAVRDGLPVETSAVAFRPAGAPRMDGHDKGRE